MAEPGFIPLADAYKNTAPPADPKFTPVEEAYKKPELAGTDRPFPPESKMSPSAQMVVGMENNMLGREQRTVPYHHQHVKNYLGDVTSERDDGALYFKDAEGKEQITDKDKQVVLKDPSDGKYKVYKRTSDTDMGAISSGLLGLGHVVTEGSGPSALPMKLPVTAAQKVLQATKAVEDTTGVSVPISKAAATDSAIVKGIANTASNIPGGGGPFQQAAARTSSALGQAAEEAARIPTGVVANAEEAGQAARFGLNQRVLPKTADGEPGLWQQSVNAAYDKAASKVAPEARGALPRTTAVVNQLEKEFKATEQTGSNPAVKDVLGAVTHPEGINLEGFKRLKSQIGQMIQDGVAGIPNGDLKRLYGALKDDMRAHVIAEGGVRAGKNWDKAETLALVTARNRERLQKVLGVANDEGVFGKLLRAAGSTPASADAKLLGLAKRSMSPSEWNEVSSAVVQRLGWRRQGADKVFDPGKFLHDYSTLSTVGRNHLFGTSTQLRTALDSIAETARLWPKVTALGHPTSEAAHLVGMAGIFHHISSAMKIFGVANGVSRLLARPVTAASTARYLDSYRLWSIKPTQSNLTAFNNASRMLAADVDKAEEFRKDAAPYVKGTARVVGNTALTLYEALKSLAEERRGQ